MLNKIRNYVKWWAEKETISTEDKFLVGRRVAFLSAPALLLGASHIAKAAITDANGNSVNASGPLQGFSGLNVSGGGGGGTITITSMPSSGITSNTVTFNFSYTGSAPSGLTAVWQSGSISATVSGFSASTGTGTATVTTPASAATYTLHITGTGANTATATAPNTTVVSAGPTLSLTTIPAVGLTSNTVPITFTYTGGTPTGLTAVWQSGSVSGTVSGFTASGGSGSATITTPGTQASYTLTITGTGGNTASGTAGHTTVVSTSSTLTITSMPSTAASNSSVSFNFTFTGTTPSGLTALWQAGSITGTISGFSSAGSTGSATVSTPSSAATYTLHITGTGSNTASATAPNTTVVSAGVTGFPGQSGNPVGFAAAPGFTSLTSHGTSGFVSGTSGSHQVYSFLDVNAGSGGVGLSGLSFVDFVGCRFQSNNQNNDCMQLSGCSNITFTYCSFTPLASFYTSPPGGAWPSAGAWPATPTVSFQTNVNCINGSDGYQFSCNVLSGGPVTWTSCDFWGFGQNGPGFFSTTAQIVCHNCWIHDACNSSPNGYHTDGAGYQNGGTGPNNVTISNCTIASIGNSNGIAWQAATGGYDNIFMDSNYLSGYGYQTVLSTSSNMTNTTFTNNTFGTDIPWVFGPIYSNYTSMFNRSGNTWSGNKIHVISGTTPWSGSGVHFTSGDDGKFIWPDSSLNTTDF